MARRTSHLLLLGLLLCLPVLAVVGAAAIPAPLASVSDESSPVARAAEQLHLPEISTAAASVAEALLPEAASIEPASVRRDGQWLQAFRPTTVWASDRPNAARQADLPQWTPFRQLGSQVGSRLPVEYPGDGTAQLPVRGWVEAADVGPSGRPEPELELASGGNLSATSGLPVPKRTAQAWPQNVAAQFAILLDGDSGEILWGRNAHSQVAPASLTKIATSLVALERSALSDRVTVQVDSSTMWESTVMGLEPGENLSMETLLFGLMLPSGNDAGLAIAQHIAGSEAAFTELMNAKVAELGLVNTRFVNSHGLDASGHYSSAYDLSMLSRAGMRDATFARLAGTRRHEAEGYVLLNMNRLLAVYPKADGVKVGYTDAAGRAIVASATQDGHRLYAVLIRSNNPVSEAQTLLEWGFQGFSWR
jgi:hypothetical protein